MIGGRPNSSPPCGCSRNSSSYRTFVSADRPGAAALHVGVPSRRSGREKAPCSPDVLRRGTWQSSRRPWEADRRIAYGDRRVGRRAGPSQRGCRVGVVGRLVIPGGLSFPVVRFAGLPIYRAGCCFSISRSLGLLCGDRRRGRGQTALLALGASVTAPALWPVIPRYCALATASELLSKVVFGRLIQAAA